MSYARTQILGMANHGMRARSSDVCHRFTVFWVVRVRRRVRYDA